MIPMHPAALRRLQRVIATLGGVVQRTQFLSGAETVVVHLEGRSHTIDTSSLVGSGWLECRRSPFIQCTPQCEGRGDREVCRACGGLSRPLPESVRTLVERQR